MQIQNSTTKDIPEIFRLYGNRSGREQAMENYDRG
jgi:hypothetical protein